MKRPMRAFHLDLKGLPPTPGRLHEIVALAKASGFNAVLVEWEDQFPWKEKRYRSETAYTPSDVARFHKYCAELKMQVIPLIQCLGHMETWLRLPEHKGLREVPHLVDVLNPLARGAQTLVAGLMEEILARTPGLKYFHLGGDEAWTFGQHPDTAAFIERHGKAALYLRHVEPLLDLLIARGIRPILWHDMMVDWAEADLAALAKKADLCVWGYYRYDRGKEPWLRELSARERKSGLPIFSGGGGAVSEQLFARFQRAAVRMWGAGAYKCGTGDFLFSDLPDAAGRLANALDWRIHSERFPFAGLIATGWSRNTTALPQYIPIDAALMPLVATGILWNERTRLQSPETNSGKILRSAETRARALLKRRGELGIQQRSHDLMARLSKRRRMAWVEAVRLREMLACMEADPRRSSLAFPEKGLRYLREHISHMETELRAEILSHFAPLVPRVWLERYLFERLDPLRQEHQDLQRRVTRMFPSAEG